MAIPENESICPKNYKGDKFNGEYKGAMAENYGHDGIDKRSYQSGFHWGTGSALTTAAILKTKLGDIYIDGSTHTAIGVDGIIVKETQWGDTVRLVTSQLANLSQLNVCSDRKDDIGKIIVIDKKQEVKVSACKKGKK
jgi:hypothetical protein